jgi:excinuclease ABC subunit B
MELAIANDPLARQAELESSIEAPSPQWGEGVVTGSQDPLTRPHKPTLDEMGPHNREIPLASFEKRRGRSKAGKPGTHAFKKKH